MTGISGLIVASSLTVLATVLIFIVDKKIEKFTNLDYAVKQVIIGCLFGIMSICGTEFGINIDGFTMNVRDAAPLCAGMIFGAPSGIIAGLIGGLERWMAVYWGVGYYTRIACTLGTIAAGFLAALVRKNLMEDKVPSWIYAFFLAMVAEVLHMLLVFLTNMNGFVDAYHAVEVCAPVMIPFVGVTVGIAVLLVNLMSGKSATKGRNERGIASLIVMMLFVSVVVAFGVTITFVWSFQNHIAEGQAQQSITNTLNDINNDIQDAIKYDKNVDKIIHAAASNRHVGSTGGVVIFAPDGSIVGQTAFADEVGDPGIAGQLDRDSLGKYKEEVLYTIDDDNLSTYMMVRRQGGYVAAGYFPIHEADITKNTSTVITAFIVIVILCIMFMQIFAIAKNLIVKNIREINDKLGEITEGNLDVKVDIKGSEEFVSLSDDINETVDTLRHYIEEAEQRIDKDLALAKEIQYSVLNTEYPTSRRFELYANMLAAKEVGGDFYDFYKQGDNKCLFLVADVSGKGIPAAMFMMRAKALISSLADSGADMATVLTKANEELCKNNEAGMFITAWLGILDLDTNIVHYANAGHNPPVVVREKGNIEYLKGPAGFVLAGIEGIRYKIQTLQLNPGDSLFLYTDGVTEATNADNELYGEDRLLAEIREASHMNPANMCKYIKRSVDRFVGSAPQFDDITMLSLRIRKPDEAGSEMVTVPTEESIRDVEAYFENRTELLDVPIAIASKIGIIVDEIYSNIVRYSGATMAKVDCRASDGQLELVFKDNGIEYNILEKEDPDVELDAEAREIGGLGIFMVKKIADRVDYRRENGKNYTNIYISI